MNNVPFAKPDILAEDIPSIEEVLLSGWLTHGKYTSLFEEKFCSFTGAKYAITVSNCTSGLHLSCMAQGIKAGDEVIVPAMTHTATANAVEYTGAKAVFADVHPVTGNILPKEIERMTTSKTKGVIVVHMAGYPCEMDVILDACRENNLFLIEDCAHALGTTYKRKHVGNFGNTGNYSFYPTKQITTGEGGMVICNNREIEHFIKTRKAFGIDTPPEKRNLPGIYDVQALGYNYRMTDFQAAIGYAQLVRYTNVNLERRKKNAKLYVRELSNLLDFINFPGYIDDNSYFLFQILVKEPYDRNTVVAQLQEDGIGCSIHYATPVPLMSYYKEKYGFNVSNYPNAIKYAQRSISLPIHPYLTEEDIHCVVDKLKEIFIGLQKPSAAIRRTEKEAAANS